MPRRPKTMTLEQCAARMTNFLARKPKAKTAAYVATLPKREPIKAMPMDYVACPFERARMANAGIPVEAGPNDRLKPPKVDYDPTWGGKFQAYVSPKPHPKRKDRIRPSLREPDYHRLMVRMIDAQAGLCFLCGDTLFSDTDMAQNDPYRASFDHVVPVSKGGLNERNRLAAHRICNGRKGDRMPRGCEKLFLEAVNLHLFG